MAIHVTGNPLYELVILRIPINSNLDKLCPRDDKSGSADWEGLKAALQSTRTIDVSAGNRHDVSATNQGYLHGYLCALLSSPCLEEIRCRFQDLDINIAFLTYNGKFATEMPIKFNPVGTAFATAHCENLRWLDICHIRFTEEELTNFFHGLETN